MTIEQELSKNVFKMMDLHNKFSEGLYEEMNSLYSNDFQGRLYMPWVDEVRHFNAENIKEGNKSAAEYYKGKNIQFAFTGLKIVPQSTNQATVSYEVVHQNKEQVVMVRGLALEVWRKESDGQWRIIRWYEEKGMRT
ncbi:Cif family virulence factor [Salinibacillus xinjiangensis]|uniref:DUF4440 domain-containing protein n=1 Tax=Salinibacillus xinjiangensis TaxID=1229268 RepID=A0A6G1X8G8_9BACI|nr:DUF4440 domain-containing protein [Salinibacillus xinjiangensis]MRG87170.1 DUF4440 domain-containing protein [Salinibacillus xinjiangensis]